MLDGEQSFKRHEPSLIQQFDVLRYRSTESNLLIASFDFKGAETFRETFLEPKGLRPHGLGHQSVNILVIDHTRGVHIRSENDEIQIGPGLEIGGKVRRLALVQRLEGLESLVRPKDRHYGANGRSFFEAEESGECRPEDLEAFGDFPDLVCRGIPDQHEVSGLNTRPFIGGGHGENVEQEQGSEQYSSHFWALFYRSGVKSGNDDYVALRDVAFPLAVRRSELSNASLSQSVRGGSTWSRCVTWTKCATLSLDD